MQWQMEQWYSFFFYTNSLTGALGNTIIHIITDFMIFLLPIPVLARLSLHRKQKIGLLCVFSLGFVCVLTACRRDQSRHHLCLSHHAQAPR